MTPEKTADPFQGLVSNDFEKRLAETFLLFDELGNKSIDLPNIPFAVRALGCVPTEEELKSIMESARGAEKSGMVHLKWFLQHVGGLITELKMMPATGEQLMSAFRRLDGENQGYLTPDFLEKTITKEGETFNQLEVKRMFSLAVDPDTKQITYEYYINQLMVNMDPDIYSIIPEPPPEEPKKR